MKVDHAETTRALELHGGVVPRFPKVTVTLSPPDADGLAEMTVSGSAHAEEGDVARALGLQVDEQRIKRTTPTTIGYVVSEPARQPSPGAISSRGIKRTGPPARQVERDVIEANAPAKPRAKTRRK